MKALRLSSGRRVVPVALLLSYGLTIATVAIPLTAYASGYSSRVIGLLMVCGAGARSVLRVVLARVMHRFTEVALVVASTGLLGASCSAVLVSQMLGVLVVAQVLQGIARGVFWIGLQSHVVRSMVASLVPLAWLME